MAQRERHRSMRAIAALAHRLGTKAARGSSYIFCCKARPVASDNDILMRHRLTSTQREQLYKREADKARDAGRGDYPICNICDLPIIPGSLWDASHQKHKPHWLGGDIEGCAHARCNRSWNNQHDTPLFAKSERVRKRHLDITRSSTPLPGGRDDRIKKTMSGKVIDRQTGQSLFASRNH